MIKVFLTNNGGEFTSKEFDSFCKEARIKNKFTLPCKPQHNGFVEHNNISITKTSKSMIHDMTFPMCHWVEYCNIVVFILNRFMHGIRRDKTP
jgi:transposase InsO family protein